MKFGHSLRFNCVSDWSDHYISYESFKKLIHIIENSKPLQQVQTPSSHFVNYSSPISFANESNTIPPQNAPDESQLPLLTKKYTRAIINRSNSKESKINMLEIEFLEFFAKEVEKVKQFYEKKRKDAFHTLSQYGYLHNMVAFSPTIMRDDSLSDMLMEFFILLNNLKEFLELNSTGFLKIIKKHEKYGWIPLGQQLKDLLERNLSLSSLIEVNEWLNLIELCYAKNFFDDKREDASAHLRHLLRQHITWERNTVWKEMVEAERKHYNNITENFPASQHEIQQQSKCFALNSESKWKWARIIGCFAVFLFFWLVYPISMDKVISNCFAMFLLVVLLWSFEIFPLFVTSLLIPLLGVLLGVLKQSPSNTEPIGSFQASHRLFQAMFSHIIMLLLGSFTLAAVASKYNISKRLACKILVRFRNISTSTFLLLLMGMSGMTSIVLSNVAAPVLLLSVIAPVLRAMDRRKNICGAIVMAICVGANIGGMTSPISSPQNVFALEELAKDRIYISWLEWLFQSIPLSIICMVICWRNIVWYFCVNVPICTNMMDEDLFDSLNQPQASQHQLPLPRWQNEPWTNRQLVVLCLFVLTIILWIFHSNLSWIVGELGMLATVPILLFFGFGLLTKEDFNAFPWNIAALVMGGLCLGECISSSGLLSLIGEKFSAYFLINSFLVQLLSIGFLMLVCSSFISHTVSSIILLPIVHSLLHKANSDNTHDIIGEKTNILIRSLDLTGGFGQKIFCRSIIMTATLVCSCGMSMPFSSFPNVTAIAAEDHVGRRYLKKEDFLKVATISTIQCYLVVVGWIYGWVKVLQ